MTDRSAPIFPAAMRRHFPRNISQLMIDVFQRPTLLPHAGQRDPGRRSESPFGIILLQYFARVVFPFRLPGGLVSVVLGTILAWSQGVWGNPMMDGALLKASTSQIGFYLPVLSITDLFSAFQLQDIREYLAVIIPMGIFNVIGSLQNIESAEASGDTFNTRDSLLANGIGTVVGSFFGSPFPTTIYIGHPGWKALGARAGYSTLNGIFMTFSRSFRASRVYPSTHPRGSRNGDRSLDRNRDRFPGLRGDTESTRPAVVIGILPRSQVGSSSRSIHIQLRGSIDQAES